MAEEKLVSRGISAQRDGLHYRHMVTEGLTLNALSLHTHAIYELIYFLGGDATHVIEDRKYKLKRGDLVFVRPFHYHFIQIDGEAAYDRFDILFDPERHGIDGVDGVPKELEVIHIPEGSTVDGILRRCDQYYGQLGEDRFFSLLPHMLCELLCNISLAPSEGSEESQPVSPLISAALKYMNENLSTPISIGEIAERLFVSESYLFRLFRQELHRTPKKYLTEKRLMMAQKKIREGGLPSRVCEECGFGDYTGFYRNYVQRFGHSPSEEKPQ